ncbi:MAG: hypothetical protein AB1440_16540, partial [Pseudomonadota bacterium]
TYSDQEDDNQHDASDKRMAFYGPEQIAALLCVSGLRLGPSRFRLVGVGRGRALAAPAIGMA